MKRRHLANQRDSRPTDVRSVFRLTINTRLPVRQSNIITTPFGPSFAPTVWQETVIKSPRICESEQVESQDPKSKTMKARGAQSG